MCAMDDVRAELQQRHEIEIVSRDHVCGESRPVRSAWTGPKEVDIGSHCGRYTTEHRRAHGRTLMTRIIRDQGY